MCGTSIKSNEKTVSKSAEVADTEKKAPVEHYNIKVADFFDPRKPWILVPNGSYQGFFDFVPPNFRTGPWNSLCCVYLAALSYWIGLTCVDAFFSRPPPAQNFSCHAKNSWQHWYNVTGFLWTTYIAYTVVKSDISWGAWACYTLQSWSLIIARHGLSALAPYFPSVMHLNEYLRFPTLVQATITFVIWNFALVPVIFSQMKTAKDRKGFIKLCTSFLLIQLHLLNIVFAGVNGIWGTPARTLNNVDFAVALLFALQYVLFYLLVLDRLGIHHYFIFSPRTPLALFWWTVFVASIYGFFSVWKDAIMKYGMHSTA